MERESAFTVSYALSLATRGTKALGDAIQLFERANPGDVYSWRVGITETLEGVLAAFDRAIALAEETP